MPRAHRAAALALAVLSTRCGGTTGAKATATPRATSSGSAIARKAEATAAAPGHAVYLVGGDSRGDGGNVLPWAFEQARKAHASGFLFLGDMEWSRGCDGHFHQVMLEHLAPVPLYPVLGNHEVAWFGFLKRGDQGQADVERAFQVQFLGTPQTPVASTFGDHVVYSVDLAGGLHFIALDNVSDDGFGRAQLDWLRADLLRARSDPANRYLAVGMHKPFAGTCVGGHSMEEGKAAGKKDTAEALAMLAGPGRPVDLILASHVHQFAQFKQAGIQTYVTGGLGAHLRSCSCGDCLAIHHVLQLDVSDERLEVTLIPSPHPPGPSAGEGEEDEGEVSPDLRCADRAEPGRTASPSSAARAAELSRGAPGLAPAVGK